MRKIAVLLLAFVGGCGAQFFNPYYDRPNPWRTESDRERYLDKKEEDWLLELRQPYELPQNGGVAMTLPDLEAFRDTVLVNADAMVLLRIRDQSARKARMLQARAESMAPLNETNKVQIFELLWAVRTEKMRLQMIDDRLGAGR